MTSESILLILIREINPFKPYRENVFSHQLSSYVCIAIYLTTTHDCMSLQTQILSAYICNYAPSVNHHFPCEYIAIYIYVLTISKFATCYSHKGILLLLSKLCIFKAIKLDVQTRPVFLQTQSQIILWSLNCHYIDILLPTIKFCICIYVHSYT